MQTVNPNFLDKTDNISKFDIIKDLCNTLNITLNNTVFIGDDLTNKSFTSQVH